MICKLTGGPFDGTTFNIGGDGIPPTVLALDAHVYISERGDENRIDYAYEGEKR